MNSRGIVGLAVVSILFAGGVAHAESASTEHSVAVGEESFGGPMRLGVELDLGLSGRLEGSDSGYHDDERAGMLLEGGVFFSPARLFDVGLSYQRTQLGTEIARPGDALAANTLFRSVNTVWLNLRTYPLRWENASLFVGLMAGPSWESSKGHITYPPADISGVMRSQSCSASGPAALALGVTAGADVDLGGGLAFLARLTGASHHLSSDPLTGSDGAYCGPGVGSAATLDARIGFAYRFDLSGGDWSYASIVTTDPIARRLSGPN